MYEKYNTEGNLTVGDYVKFVTRTDWLWRAVINHYNEHAKNNSWP